MAVKSSAAFGFVAGSLAGVDFFLAGIGTSPHYNMVAQRLILARKHTFRDFFNDFHLLNKSFRGVCKVARPKTAEKASGRL
jgi:hypothetical protein